MSGHSGLKAYYLSKIEELEYKKQIRSTELKRLEAQRNELNGQVRGLRDEIQLLQEPGSYVGEVIKLMGKKKCLCKVGQEGKYIVNSHTSCVDVNSGL